jgi:predicted Rossmann fold flavoprotein
LITKNIIIVGGGAAGLFAGLNLKSCNALVLEKMDSPGKKLLMAGSGRCNISHEGNIKDFLIHYADKSKFIKPALMEYPNTKLLELLHRNGMETVSYENGKIFPKSESSKDVLNLFLQLIRKAGTEILYKQNVIDIQQNDDKFIVSTNHEKYAARYLILAAGGSSYPSSGSDGLSYNLAKKLGHSIVPPTPALTAVITENYKFADISGVSLRDIEISLFRDGKKINKHRGDLAFTHKSLSGPGIIDFSRYIKSGDTLAINFINVNEDSFREILIADSKSHGKKTIRNYLKQFPIPESLLNMLLALERIDANKNFSELSKEHRNKIVEMLTAYKFTVARKVGFNQAMVTAGGVSTTEINSKTMESKIVPNMYVVGEFLDIDGDTGGYNLQAAFSTAYLACKSIKQKLNIEDTVK